MRKKKQLKAGGERAVKDDDPSQQVHEITDP